MTATPNPAPGPAAAVPPDGPPRARWTDLLLGLPALAAAAGLLVVVGGLGRRPALQAAYEAKAAAAAQAGSLPDALILYKRLTTLAPDREDYRLTLAELVLRAGNPARAETLARTMAPPDDSPGYPPARLWLARRLLSDLRDSPQRLAEADDQLKRVLRAEPKAAEPKFLLGQIYLANGRPKEARPYLEQVAEGNPQLLLLLARACREGGDPEEARRRTEQAVVASRKLGQERPDDPDVNMMLAASLAATGDFAAGLDATAAQLRQDTRLTPEQKAAREVKLRATAVAASAAWCDALTLAKAPPDKRLQAIESGLALAPDHPILLGRLGDLLTDPNADAAAVRTRLEAAIARGVETAVPHFSLGNADWARGRTAEARDHWEKAVAAKDFPPQAANNLAYALAFSEPKDPNRALDLIDKALKRIPGDPMMRGTRGEVLTALGRWKDAAEELEGTLANGYRSPGVRKSLAEAYDHLGLPDKAAEQRKAAGS